MNQCSLLPIVLATIPNGTVTECSLSSLTFEFWEERQDDLDFAAACLDSNRTCVRENQYQHAALYAGVEGSL